MAESELTEIGMVPPMFELKQGFLQVPHFLHPGDPPAPTSSTGCCARCCTPPPWWPSSTASGCWSRSATASSPSSRSCPLPPSSQKWSEGGWGLAGAGWRGLDRRPPCTAVDAVLCGMVWNGVASGRHPVAGFLPNWPSQQPVFNEREFRIWSDGVCGAPPSLCVQWSFFFFFAPLSNSWNMGNTATTTMNLQLRFQLK